jgi:aryl-alcohol dehydrogenase-like predicted oxidoreductase
MARLRGAGRARPVDGCTVTAQERPAGGRAGLGLGLAAVGRPAYITPGRAADLPPDRSPAGLRERAHQLLDAAVDSGLDYLDTARSYGLAEQFLGSWLSGRSTAPFVASKWGYRYTADWRADAVQHEVKEHSAAVFDRQLAETTELLGTWLRLYQVHSLTVDSPLWDDDGVLRRLVRLRDAGVEVGFSTSGPRQADAVRRALELTVDGEPVFSSVQSTWNLLEPSAQGALAEAREAGWRVVVKEALANGRLVTGSSTAGAALAEVGRAHGVGPDAVALAAALAQPWASVVLSGAVTVHQLRSNAAARDLVGLVDVAALLEPEPAEEYWAARSLLGWQ